MDRYISQASRYIPAAVLITETISAYMSILDLYIIIIIIIMMRRDYNHDPPEIPNRIIYSLGSPYNKQIIAAIPRGIRPRSMIRQVSGGERCGH